MAPFGQRARRFHPSRASADHHHLLLLDGRLRPVFELLAHTHVHRTGRGRTRLAGRLAETAEDAVSDLVEPSFLRLVRQVRVRHQSPTEHGKVGLALAERLFRGEDVQLADCDHRHIDDLLDGRGEREQGTVGHIHIGELPLVRLEGTARDIECIDPRGDEHLGVFLGILDGDAAFQVIVAVHPDVDREIRSHSLAHPLDQLHGEAGTVFPAAAVLIGAVVGAG